MKKIFNVVYCINGRDKEVHFDYIPEVISSDEIKLNIYLKKEIAKQEHIEEDEISIVKATCTFKFI
ncbi:hypothetical protein [Paenibacillus sp. B-A-8]|uniref:hypothetical protein n=1 Tax=Paenibacillus sp. B-A-8 TaxID=3400419 RepID=UPI003B019728